MISARKMLWRMGLTWLLILAVMATATLSGWASLVLGVAMICNGSAAGYGIAIWQHSRQAIRRFPVPDELATDDSAAGMPEPPENVRIVHADGTTTPLDLLYSGVDDRGMHMWRAIDRRLFRPEEGDVIRWAKLPDRNVIAVGVELNRYPESRDGDEQG